MQWRGENGRELLCKGDLRPCSRNCRGYLLRCDCHLVTAGESRAAVSSLSKVYKTRTFPFPSAILVHLGYICPLLMPQGMRLSLRKVMEQQAQRAAARSTICHPVNSECNSVNWFFFLRTTKRTKLYHDVSAPLNPFTCFSMQNTNQAMSGIVLFVLYLLSWMEPFIMWVWRMDTSLSHQETSPRGTGCRGLFFVRMKIKTWGSTAALVALQSMQPLT